LPRTNPRTRRAKHNAPRAKLNLIKLCVGADSVDHLVRWQQARMEKRLAEGLDPRPRHLTRMGPKRAEELLDGGSLYWVIKGNILARQRIEAMEEHIGEDGIRKCDLILAPQLFQTLTRRKRAFQGWRYLAGSDAPPDLGPANAAMSDLPVELANELDALGVVARLE